MNLLDALGWKKSESNSDAPPTTSPASSSVTIPVSETEDLAREMRSPQMQALLPEVPTFLGAAEKHAIGDVVKIYNTKIRTYVLAQVVIQPNGRKGVVFLSPKKENLAEHMDVVSAQRILQAPWPSIQDPQFHKKLQRLLFEELGLVPKSIGRPDPHACTRQAKAGRIELEPHQKILAATLAFGPYRGLLAVHSLGSGKTCAAIATMNEFLRAKEASRGVSQSGPPPGKTKEEPSVLFIIPPRASLIENLVKNIGQCPGFLRDQIEKRNLQGAQRSALINRHIRVLSYVSLANRIAKKELSLDGKLIILDEAHNLFYPSKPQFKAKYAAAYKALRTARNVKLLLMTATPVVDGFHDLTRLASLCLAPGEPDLPATARAFQDRYVDLQTSEVRPLLAQDLRGLVSWFNQEENPSLFAQKVFVPPKETTVTEDHHAKWKETSAREAKGYGVESLDAYEALEKSASFVEGSRRHYKASSEVNNYPYRSYRAKGVWTPKFEELRQALEAAPREKHVIFSRHLEAGVRATAHYLESKGWTRMSNNRSDAVTAPPKTYHPLVDQLHAIQQSKESDAEKAQKRQDAVRKLPVGHRGFMVLTKDTPQRDIARALALFNSPENMQGSLARAILLDEKYFEGVSLTHTTQVHFFEPLPNAQLERQAIARAIRHCSHAGQAWPWTVKIHRYFHVGPTEGQPMTDHLLQAYNERMKRRIQTVNDAMQKASIEHGWGKEVEKIPVTMVQAVRRRLSILDRVREVARFSWLRRRRSEEL